MTYIEAYSQLLLHVFNLIDFEQDADNGMLISCVN